MKILLQNHQFTALRRSILCDHVIELPCYLLTIVIIFCRICEVCELREASMKKFLNYHISLSSADHLFLGTK